MMLKNMCNTTSLVLASLFMTGLSSPLKAMEDEPSTPHGQKRKAASSPSPSSRGLLSEVNQRFDSEIIKLQKLKELLAAQEKAVDELKEAKSLSSTLETLEAQEGEIAQQLGLLTPTLQETQQKRSDSHERIKSLRTQMSALKHALDTEQKENAALTILFRSQEAERDKLFAEQTSLQEQREATEAKLNRFSFSTVERPLSVSPFSLDSDSSSPLMVGVPPTPRSSGDVARSSAEPASSSASAAAPLMAMPKIVHWGGREIKSILKRGAPPSTIVTPSIHVEALTPEASSPGVVPSFEANANPSSANRLRKDEQDAENSENESSESSSSESDNEPLTGPAKDLSWRQTREKEANKAVRVEEILNEYQDNKNHLPSAVSVYMIKQFGRFDYPIDLTSAKHALKKAHDIFKDQTEQWKKLADSNPEYAYSLGMMFNGLKEQIKKKKQPSPDEKLTQKRYFDAAKDYFSKGDSQNHSESTTSLAFLLLEEQENGGRPLAVDNPKHPVTLLKKAAVLGNGRAMYYLGDLSEKGKMPGELPGASAEKWYKDSSRAGFDLAKIALTHLLQPRKR